jgi:hypothetical protein
MTIAIVVALIAGGALLLFFAFSVGYLHGAMPADRANALRPPRPTHEELRAAAPGWEWSFDEKTQTGGYVRRCSPGDIET